MTIQDVINSWCDGDKRAIRDHIVKEYGFYPSDGPCLQAFLEAAPRTVRLPSDVLTPEELRKITEAA